MIMLSNPLRKTDPWGVLNITFVAVGIMLATLIMTPTQQAFADSRGTSLLTKALKINKVPPVLVAYKQAYPETITDIRLIRGEWAIITRSNTTLYWANGRILPEHLRSQWETYRSYIYYTYPKNMQDPKNIPQQRVESLNRYAKRVRKTSKSTAQESTFAKELYGANTAAGIANYIVPTTLFGKKIRVHSLIEPHLKKVDNSVSKRAQSDPEIRAFLKNIKSVWGYNWRDISGTQIISYHSYGLAVDILPYNPKNKIIYWQWASQFRDDWLQVPLKERWSPPLSVISIFEQNGFIWGGKWTLYDTMHFEYRPEMLILSK